MKKLEEGTEKVEEQRHLRAIVRSEKQNGFQLFAACSSGIFSASRFLLSLILLLKILMSPAATHFPPSGDQPLHAKKKLLSLLPDSIDPFYALTNQEPNKQNGGYFFYSQIHRVCEMAQTRTACIFTLQISNFDTFWPRSSFNVLKMSLKLGIKKIKDSCRSKVVIVYLLYYFNLLAACFKI